MMEPERPAGVHRPMRRLNPTVLALLAGLVVLLLLVAYFTSNRDPDQDKLKNPEMTQTRAAASPEKLCASRSTYDLIKRDLFRRAAQVRGSDQAAYDKLATYAAIRMDNPVLETESDDTGAVGCSGTLSVDLPPGVVVVGGRRTLTADVDYTVQKAADDSGTVVLLRNAEAIVTPLATLARVAQTPQQEAQSPQPAGDSLDQPMGNVPPVQPQPPVVQTPLSAPRPVGARPSFDCRAARTRGEIAVCADAGLASLDRNMSAQYGRAMAGASPEQQALLRRTRDRFLGYRDRCPDNRCIGDAYAGRMREIRDIMDERWAAPR